jgi:hypothetical protein
VQVLGSKQRLVSEGRREESTRECWSWV